MNPTQTQLDARLNPTAVSFQVPNTQGLFRGVGDYGTQLFRLVGNKIEAVNLVDLLVPQSERVSIGNSGAQANVALQRLKSQYGLDWNSLPAYNLGDLNSQGYKLNYQVARKAGPEGGPDNFIHGYSGDLTSFLGASQASSGTNVTVNNTPNTLGTPSSGVTGIVPPSVSLKPGDSGEEVKKLQDYLVSVGLMTRDQVNTGYGTYGPQTTAAVAALQQKLGVDNSTGVGYFGPRTMQAITSNSGATSTPGSQSNSSTSNNNTPLPNTNIPQYDDALKGLLSNPNLSSDQKAIIENLYNTVSTNDSVNATKLISAFNAATAYSSPYFRAQTLIATDALARALGASEGDLAFQETKLKNTLDDLIKNTEASKGQLSFQHEQELKQLADSYEKDLEDTRQGLAATGMTSSSVRAKSEKLLNEQNQGLVESSNRKFSFQTGNLDRGVSIGQRDTGNELAYLKDKATQDKINLLRHTESQVGTNTLRDLGYTNLLGTSNTPIGGEIPRRQVQDALSFSNSFVF